MGTSKKYKSLESRIPIKDAREIFVVKEDPMLVARLHNFDFRVVKRLTDAIEDPASDWDYRTVGSLALQTGLPESEVSQMLRVTPAGRESPLRSKGGEKLYRGSDVRMNKLEIGEMIRRVLAKDF
jgi:hypothetical protein